MSEMDKIIAIHGAFPISTSIDHLIFSRLRRGRFGPCLPTGRRVGGDQPGLERERNPAILSRTYEWLHVLLSIIPAHYANMHIDPAPTATIGGMLSTGCSGSQLLRDTVL